MNWPWRNPPPPDPTAETNPPAATIPLDALLARADALRDARHWADAATAYHEVLQRAPDRAPLHVQLGHALKESGDFPGAESAYRHALHLSPDSADSHLQLGHVLKLQGRRPAAVAAYAAALRADRGCTPALRELIGLGESWEAEQASGLGLPVLAALLETAGQLRTALARLEQALPDAASLNSVPPALFRSRFRLPPPPRDAPVPGARGVLVLNPPGPRETVALLRSLAEAPPNAVVVVTADAEIAAALRQFDNGGPGCPVQVVPPVPPPPLPPGDWLLVCTGGSVLVPGAAAWLDWAQGQLAADAYYIDEHGPVLPVLKAAHDTQAEVSPVRHTMLALRAGFAAQVVHRAMQAEDPLQAMADAAGTIGHLPRMLAERSAEPPPPARRTRSVDAPEHPGRIGVVIPTRNGGAMLRDCLDRLRATADQPGRLDIVVLDNGSDAQETLALLDALARDGTAVVVRDDAPFNWARLSNAGAAACQSALLLFLNDDVAMEASGWDVTLRRHLARPDIGAVGARLRYPDGGLQHGGIVFGPDGRAEHEGVAAIGVPPDVAARWVTRRRVGAVTGAWLGCRRDAFAAAGGFDAAHFPIWFNDIDFCLKLREAGQTILYEPAIHAVHHESRTLSARPARQAIWDESLADLRRRWGDALAVDPGFNPHFARTGRPFELMTEPSPDAIRAHLLRSASAEPWRISRSR